ncbi:hypothetical protein DVS77_00760 [Mycolicibacterium moriokaense]|nr:hypothetical protein DVS77_00760 [Mycolicibacterium moriokaense]
MIRVPASRPLAAACVFLVAISALSGCAGSPPDRRAQSDHLVEQVRALPGVRSASADVANSVAQGDTHVWLSVAVADDVTADQVAAITTRYLDDLRATGYPGYQTELTIRANTSLFAVDSGQDPLSNADQIVGQARDWIALRHQFPGAAVDLRAALAHSSDTTRFRNSGHPAIATISLADPAGYRDVGAAVTSLRTGFPQLSDGTWTISAGSAHPAVITASKRMPSGQELDVWNALNADQAIPHIDAMTINAPLMGPVWISEKTLSRDPAVALRLASDHLPIIATLPAPVLYTATDKLQGHHSYDGRITGPVAVTTGGCTPRNYRFDRAEQKLIDAYERCPLPPA